MAGKSVTAMDTIGIATDSAYPAPSLGDYTRTREKSQ